MEHERLELYATTESVMMVERWVHQWKASQGAAGLPVNDARVEAVWDIDVMQYCQTQYKYVEQSYTIN